MKGENEMTYKGEWLAVARQEIKRLRKLLKLAPIVVLAVLPLWAQSSGTTYTLNKPFYCDPASMYPVTSLSEFTCRINNPTSPAGYYPNFLDASGNKVGLYWWESLPRLYVVTENWTVTNATFQVTNFTTQTVAFNWSGTDSNGNPHNGTVKAIWTSRQVCGGRYCWYHPVLEPGSTIDVVQ
jgi:hypothetical protein